MKKKTNNPPVTARWLIGKMTRYQELYSISVELDEAFRSIAVERGQLKAIIWYWYQAVTFIFKYSILTFQGSTAMVKNYLKIAFRNLNRHKGYSFINIFGLSVGIASFIFILIFVRFETRKAQHAGRRQ